MSKSVRSFRMREWSFVSVVISPVGGVSYIYIYIYLIFLGGGN